MRRFTDYALISGHSCAFFREMKDCRLRLVITRRTPSGLARISWISRISPKNLHAFTPLLVCGFRYRTRAIRSEPCISCRWVLPLSSHFQSRAGLYGEKHQHVLRPSLCLETPARADLWVKTDTAAIKPHSHYQLLFSRLGSFWLIPFTGYASMGAVGLRFGEGTGTAWRTLVRPPKIGDRRSLRSFWWARLV